MSGSNAKHYVVRLMVLALFIGVTASGVARAQTPPAITEYKRLCEASTGVFLDNKHFAVASDETNTLQFYERGKAEPVGSVNLRKFLTNFKKSDIEASARIADRVYWISSHSRKKDGSADERRRVFFATKIGEANGLPTLTGEGRVVKDLLQAILDATNVKDTELNIEAMAATPKGELLIGLRAPHRVEKDSGNNDRKNAIAVVLNNPALLIESSEERPKFSSSFTLDLDGRGLRSMELISKDDEPARYLIVAGPAEDADGFAFYSWVGPGTNPQPGKITQPVALKDLSDAIKGLFPEAAMVVPGTRIVQILSDEGDVKVESFECNDDDDNKLPFEKRRFKSVDIKP